MAALVESMFYTRERPWHGLGTKVAEAPSSEDAIRLAGLDWNVVQEDIYTDQHERIDGFKCNVRDSDRKVLGVVSERYRIVQNREAFSFTDSLLQEGVRYETAGSLMGGRKVWLLARMPHDYIISGDRFIPFLVFANTHDGSGSVRVALTPIRVVCNNTLNLALNTAQRSWSMIHTGNIDQKIAEAQDTLFHAEHYMDALGRSFEELQRIKLSDQKVMEYIETLLPVPEDASAAQKRNVQKLRDNLKMCYFDAPDLKSVGKNAYRFVNSVSDFATHAGSQLRKTANYQENLFMKTYEGNPLTDKAYKLVLAAA